MEPHPQRLGLRLITQSSAAMSLSQRPGHIPVAAWAHSDPCRIVLRQVAELTGKAAFTLLLCFVAVQT